MSTPARRAMRGAPCWKGVGGDQRRRCSSLRLEVSPAPRGGGAGSGAARAVQLGRAGPGVASGPPGTAAPRPSALALLLPGGAAADDHHAAVAADDLAVLADGLDRRVDLHLDCFLSLSSYRPGGGRYFSAVR